MEEVCWDLISTMAKGQAARLKSHAIKEIKHEGEEAEEVSGVFVVVFFAGDILGSIFPSQRNLAAVLVPLMGVIGVAFASCGADRVGRRPLLDTAVAAIAGGQIPRS